MMMMMMKGIFEDFYNLLTCSCLRGWPSGKASALRVARLGLFPTLAVDICPG